MASGRARFGAARAEDVSLLPYTLSNRLHITGSSILAVSSNNYAKCLLSNPAGSGKTVIVLQKILFSDATIFVEFYVNPTAGLPTTSRLINLTSATYAGVTTFKSDTDATPMSGGTKLDHPLGAGGVEVVSHTPFLVPPGTNIGFSALASGQRNIYINVLWLEV